MMAHSIKDGGHNFSPSLLSSHKWKPQCRNEFEPSEASREVFSVLVRKITTYLKVPVYSTSRNLLCSHKKKQHFFPVGTDIRRLCSQGTQRRNKFSKLILVCMATRSVTVLYSESTRVDISNIFAMLVVVFENRRLQRQRSFQKTDCHWKFVSTG